MVTTTTAGGGERCIYVNGVLAHRSVGPQVPLQPVLAIGGGGLRAGVAGDCLPFDLIVGLACFAAVLCLSQ